jgi:hypothetical protein
MDQTMSNALWFLGATVVGPIIIAVLVKRFWFRDEKDRFYVDANPVKPRPGADKQPDGTKRGRGGS